MAALTYMRHNQTQAEIDESLGVSQPAVSRAISAIPRSSRAVGEFVPAADDPDPDSQYILMTRCSRAGHGSGHKELRSGKHKTTRNERPDRPHD
jgi:hypothetical protein